MEQRVYTEDMDEISGFGGGYEANCRAMVLGGLKWLDEHPEADPKFVGMRNVFGILLEDSKAMIDATPDRDVTGAMHQASVNHVLYAWKNGWPKYQEELRKRSTDDAAPAGE